MKNMLKNQFFSLFFREKRFFSLFKVKFLFLLIFMKKIGSFLPGNFLIEKN
jgi:hypothetical protein